MLALPFVSFMLGGGISPVNSFGFYANVEVSTRAEKPSKPHGPNEVCSVIQKVRASLSKYVVS